MKFIYILALVYLVSHILASCPLGYFLEANSGTCIQCDQVMDGCGTCVSQNICTSCKLGYAPFGDRCVQLQVSNPYSLCPEGSVYDPNSGFCVVVPEYVVLNEAVQVQNGGWPYNYGVPYVAVVQENVPDTKQGNKGYGQSMNEANKGKSEVKEQGAGSEQIINKTQEVKVEAVDDKLLNESRKNFDDRPKSDDEQKKDNIRAENESISLNNDSNKTDVKEPEAKANVEEPKKSNDLNLKVDIDQKVKQDDTNSTNEAETNNTAVNSIKEDSNVTDNAKEDNIKVDQKITEEQNNNTKEDNRKEDKVTDSKPKEEKVKEDKPKEDKPKEDKENDNKVKEENNKVKEDEVKKNQTEDKPREENKNSTKEQDVKVNEVPDSVQVEDPSLMNNDTEVIITTEIEPNKTDQIQNTTNKETSVETNSTEDVTANSTTQDNSTNTQLNITTAETNGDMQKNDTGTGDKKKECDIGEYQAAGGQCLPCNLLCKKCKGNRYDQCIECVEGASAQNVTTEGAFMCACDVGHIFDMELKKCIKVQ
jgi:hypothetical protein